MNYPNILKADKRLFDDECAQVGGRYVPARPMPFVGGFRRFKAAWLVFTGRADALLWEGQ